MAKLLLDLDAETLSPETEALVKECLDATRNVHRNKSYADVSSDPPVDHDVATKILREQGLRLITELRKQEAAP